MKCSTAGSKTRTRRRRSAGVRPLAQISWERFPPSLCCRSNSALIDAIAATNAPTARTFFASDGLTDEPEPLPQPALRKASPTTRTRHATAVVRPVGVRTVTHLALAVEGLGT